MINKERLQQLAQATKGTYLLEYLDEVLREVSDIRNNINVKSEIEKEVRLAVCNVIDDLIIRKLKVLSGETTEGNDHMD